MEIILHQQLIKQMKTFIIFKVTNIIHIQAYFYNFDTFKYYNINDSFVLVRK